jgi:asparagine synthase (glutamine-hydrolysing)
MTRWLAGVFGARDRKRCSRLASALEPSPSTVATSGALQVAYSGPASELRAPLCLLDGYLDNMAELRTRLEASERSSPEQLLAAGWRRWGRDLPGQIRGDFVFLIWDQEHEQGLLARDQLGVRSLFLHEASGKLCFASEIRHLIALLPQRPAPDAASVAHWLTMSNRPGASTLYEGIRRLNPGASLLLGRDGVRERTYWTPRFTEPVDASNEDLAHQATSALELAVRRRIAPSGLTGVLMSGGLDSSSVAAVAAAQAPGSVCTYSAVFPEHPAVDESALIRELGRVLQVPGVTAEVRAGGLLASALEAIEAWEVPLRSWGDFWALPLLRAAATAGVRMTLGGDGGDELFGARSYLLADRLRRGHPIEAVRLAHELPGAGDRPPRRELAKILRNIAVEGALPYAVHEAIRRPLARRDAPRWLRPRAARALLDSDDPLAWKRLDGPRWWANTAYGLTRGIEETGVFEHQRRRAASAGLEARHPLLDLDLVQLSLRMAPLASFDRYRNRPVLRAAMAGRVPDAVRLRPGKAWFDSVIVECLDGPDGVAARRLLSDPGAEIGAYVDQRTLRRTMLDAVSLRREQPFQWMWQLWRLTTAECWLRAQANPGKDMMRGYPPPSPARIVLDRLP